MPDFACRFSASFQPVFDASRLIGAPNRHVDHNFVFRSFVCCFRLLLLADQAQQIQHLASSSLADRRAPLTSDPGERQLRQQSARLIENLRTGTPSKRRTTVSAAILAGSSSDANVDSVDFLHSISTATSANRSAPIASATTPRSCASVSSANVACGFHAGDPAVMRAHRAAGARRRRCDRRPPWLSGPRRVRPPRA